MSITIPTYSIYSLAEELRADFRTSSPQELAADIDERIAVALGVPVAPFSTSLQAAFDLKDLIFDKDGCVMVNFREYNHNGQMSFICDLELESGDFCGDSATRPRALTAALLNYVEYLFDTKDEEPFFA
jgi:hypothetical protein